MRKIRVGTRTSRLATVQTQIVTDLIRSRFPRLELEVVPISTLGDRLPLERRAEVEGKSAFTEDIERSLMDGAIDLAVHSMKDLPSEILNGLAIGATPVRADPRDVLVSRESGGTLQELRSGAVIGTSSLRRKAQLLAIRKDLSVVDLHGNIDTRLSRLERMGLDGIVIAAAGLDRLGESRRISQYLTLDEMVPAPAQGAIAVEMREGDDEIASLLSEIDDKEVRAETTSERSFAAALGIDCDIPAGALATTRGEELTLTASILSSDGSRIVKGASVSGKDAADELGKRLARRLLESGGDEILRSVTSWSPRRSARRS